MGTPLVGHQSCLRGGGGGGGTALAPRGCDSGGRGPRWKRRPGRPWSAAQGEKRHRSAAATTTAATKKIPKIIAGGRSEGTSKPYVTEKRAGPRPPPPSPARGCSAGPPPPGGVWLAPAAGIGRLGKAPLFIFHRDHFVRIGGKKKKRTPRNFFLTFFSLNLGECFPRSAG